MRTNNGNGVPAILDPDSTKEVFESERRKAWEKRLHDLLSGAVAPHNDMSSYLIGKIQAGMAQGQTLTQRLQAAREMVQHLEQETLRTEGQVNAHIADLRAWDKPPKKEVSKENPSETAS